MQTKIIRPGKEKRSINGSRKRGGGHMDFENMHSFIDMELMQVDAEIASQLRKLCGGDALHNRALHSFFRVGGKKLRPRLLLLSAFALKRNNLRNLDSVPIHNLLVSLASMVELVHSASLVHDDILDDAPLRRGQTSLNALYGNKQAVLAGDIMYSHAFEMLIRATTPEVSLMLVDCVTRMCRAEIRNLADYDYDTYLQIVEDKTASLMSFSCKAGVDAVFRDGDSRQAADALVKFGHHFGMVYQLADDLCDRDNAVVNAEPERSMGLLNDYADSARSILAGVPDSIYRTVLAGMLDYVLNESRPFINETIENNYVLENNTGG